jgi:glutathionyl-hydroquinone reductase
MITGLDIFREHFEEDTDKYILIGGGACDVQFSSRGLSFRATKDLDIILVIEVLDDSFVKKFWDFIKEGE